ncbi:MAG: hypothetical protein RLZZ385_744 [Pseudomonadota bacterium]|jgi:glycyl-tRNA synthetase beta chain
MKTQDFLVEIGTEELPPKALLPLADAFLAEMVSALTSASLPFASARHYASPRRLAVMVEGLAVTQPDRSVERYGPAVAAAFDKSGNPTPAASGFARSCGTEVTRLERATKDGVEKLVFRSTQIGEPARRLLPGMVDSALAKLPIPKRMRWGSRRVEFVRPVHWVVMLLGDEVVDGEILGLTTGRETRGHRFHYNQAIRLRNPGDYADQLSTTGCVLADYRQRKERIRELILAQGELLGAKVAVEEDLLDEVTSLVEWPVALTGNFDRHFLELPPEALISSMKSHQKCFYLTDPSGNLLPNFIAISNLQSKDPAQVVAGNEKVIRPRLADARFFFETDKKTSLEQRVDQLKHIVFQQQLGTVYEKSQRVAALAAVIARALDADEGLCRRAASLAKCDLMTRMVGEFAELQGIMGRYYALHDGEAPEVAAALNEQYMPRFAGDGLPQSLTGAILAIADKLDTIVGLFAIGQPPTGSKDPFALRRAAIGVLRILVEKNLDLDLSAVITAAVSNFDFLKPESALAGNVLDFMLERFRAWYLDDGIPAEVIQSVLALRPSSPVDVHSRILAVSHFNSLPEAQALSSANKRVSNILAKLETPLQDFSIESTLLSLDAEKLLADVVAASELDVAPLFADRNYQQGLAQLAQSKAIVDRFFDEVLVMDEDPAIRRNRLALLARLRSLFLQVADISHLHKSA